MKDKIMGYINRTLNTTIGRKLKIVNSLILIVPLFFTLIAIILIYLFFISDTGDSVAMLLRYKEKSNFNVAYSSCDYVYDSYKKQLEETGNEDINMIYKGNPAYGEAYGVVYKNDKMLQEVMPENKPKNFSALITPLDSLKDEGKLFVINNDIVTYKVIINHSQNVYTVYVTGFRGSLYSLQGSSKYYVDTFIINAMLFILVVILCYALSKVLYRSIFKRVGYGLNTLDFALEEVANGNLDYRTDYERSDEFKPICDKFNIMAEKLQSYVMQNAQQEQTRKEIIMSISHDIFSPLTSIKAYLEGLESGIANSDEAREKYFSVIKAKTTQIENTVSELLVYSKLEYDELSFSEKKIDLLEFTENFIKSRGEEYALNNVQIAIADGSQSVVVGGDESNLMRLYTNIIDNSAKYSNKPVCHVEIEVKDMGENCILVLRDDGPGVSTASIDHIFEVFYRSDSTRNQSIKGNGIGLSIVSNIVTKALKGTVKAVNADCGGLEIIITIPKAQN